MMVCRLRSQSLTSELRAMEAVVEFADNGLVNNFFIPGGAKNVAVARLDAKGQEMPMAVRGTPAEGDHHQPEPAKNPKPRP